MTIEQLLRDGADTLRDSGYVHGEREAALLMQPFFNEDTAWLMGHGEDEVADSIAEQFIESINERVSGKPIAYILGTQQFISWTLISDERALIPRPETEQLVEHLIRSIRRNKLEHGKFLEIGTGSGAIALALKKYCPEAEITATDISEDALELAQENSHKLKLDIHFLESDLFASVPKKKYDVIVANLPYVPKTKLEFVSDQILDWEPMIAIEAGEDGLKYIRPFLQQLPGFLAENGIAAIEMWHTHASPVQELAKQAGLEIPQFEKDAAGFDRFAFISN